MTEDEALSHKPAYIRSCEQGRLGEDFVLGELSRRLEGTGLVVIHANADHWKAPFDLAVMDGNRALALIENKDLRSTSRYACTQIRRRQKKRKLAYARRHEVPLVFTTISRRHEEKVSFREGLVNGVPQIFDEDLEHMVRRILKERRSVQ